MSHGYGPIRKFFCIIQSMSWWNTKLIYNVFYKALRNLCITKFMRHYETSSAWLSLCCHNGWVRSQGLLMLSTFSCTCKRNTASARPFFNVVSFRTCDVCVFATSLHTNLDHHFCKWHGRDVLFEARAVKTKMCTLQTQLINLQFCLTYFSACLHVHASELTL